MAGRKHLGFYIMKWNRTLTAGGYSVCLFCGDKVANLHTGKEDVICFCDCAGAAKFVLDQPLDGLASIEAPERDYSKPIKTPKALATKVVESIDKGDLPW